MCIKKYYFSKYFRTVLFGYHFINMLSKKKKTGFEIFILFYFYKITTPNKFTKLQITIHNKSATHNSQLTAISQQNHYVNKFTKLSPDHSSKKKLNKKW
jgi:hypothetical protein